MKQVVDVRGEYTALGLGSRVFVIKGDAVRELKDSESSEVQAVATCASGWCAVSRVDKTISVFRPDGEPTVVHSTVKRVTCLSLSSDPAGHVVLLGGDSAGDLYAFDPSARRRRALLGHAGGMLTGLARAEGRVLTADRDEKIRVSAFPRSQIVEGFLLGHAAYVSGVDAHEGASRAISCDGDGMIRLWNVDDKRELAQTSTKELFHDDDDDDDDEIEEKQEQDIPEIPEKQQEIKADTKADAQGDQDAEKEEPTRKYVYNTAKEKVPVAISMHSSGTKFAVIFDFCNAVAFYRIDDGAATMTLTKTVECNSQPLSIAFRGDRLVVLLRDPDYLAMPSPDGDEVDLPAPFAELVKIAADGSIRMPETALEKDEFGNIKMKKLNDDRGPAGSESPWNRAERIDIAKERGRRAKKRRQERSKKEKEQKRLAKNQ